MHVFYRVIFIFPSRLGFTTIFCLSSCEQLSILRTFSSRARLNLLGIVNCETGGGGSARKVYRPRTTEHFSINDIKNLVQIALQKLVQDISTYKLQY